MEFWQASICFDHTLMNLLQRAKPSIFQQSAESRSISAFVRPTRHCSAAGDRSSMGEQERERRGRRRRKGKDKGLCSCWTHSCALVHIHCGLLCCDLLIFVFFFYLNTKFRSGFFLMSPCVLWNDIRAKTFTVNTFCTVFLKNISGSQIFKISGVFKDSIFTLFPSLNY